MTTPDPHTPNNHPDNTPSQATPDTTPHATKPGHRRHPNPRPSTRTRTRTDRPTGGKRRQVGRAHYGAGALILIATITATLIGGTTTLTTGTPDAGLITGNGPLSGILPGHNATHRPTNPHTEVVIDLNHDGKNDTHIDTNNDGKHTNTDAPIADLTTQAHTVINHVGPNPKTTKTTSAALTPAGTNWWAFITSQTPLQNLQTKPAPNNATWYATTTGNALNPQTNALTIYTAVHVGFTTPQAAQTAADTLADNSTNTLTRGNVVTLTPAFVYPDQEPFPAHVKNTQFTPQAAIWTINFTQQHTQAAQDHPTKANRKHYTNFFAHLGYGTNSTWYAVATNPNGPWTGTLTDYHPDNINIPDAAAELAATIQYTCNDENTDCMKTDLGLQDLGAAYTITDHTETFGRNPYYLPETAPEKTVLTFGYNTAYATGVINTTQSRTTTPHGLFQGWITNPNPATHTATLTVLTPPTTETDLDHTRRPLTNE